MWGFAGLGMAQRARGWLLGKFSSAGVAYEIGLWRVVMPRASRAHLCVWCECSSPICQGAPVDPVGMSACSDC